MWNVSVAAMIILVLLNIDIVYNLMQYIKQIEPFNLFGCVRQASLEIGRG